MAHQLGVQLYSLKDFPGGYPAAFEAVKRIGIESVEIWSGAVPDDPDVATSVGSLRSQVEDAGMSLVCGHVAYGEADTRYSEWVSFLKDGGSETWVIPFANADSLQGWLDFLPTFRELAARLAADDLDLAYHNHHTELAEYDGKRVMEHLLDTMPELMAQFHINQFLPERGIALPDWIRKYQGRVAALHVNDADANGFCRFGEGVCDTETCIRTALDTGVTTYIIEEPVMPATLDDVKRDVEFTLRLIG